MTGSSPPDPRRRPTADQIVFKPDTSEAFDNEVRAGEHLFAAYKALRDERDQLQRDLAAALLREQHFAEMLKARDADNKELRRLSEWRPIMPEDLPKTGDEVGHWWTLGRMWVLREYKTGESFSGDTHFRLVNPPVQDAEEPVK